jgi:hypothetical protein
LNRAAVANISPHTCRHVRQATRSIAIYGFIVEEVNMHAHFLELIIIMEKGETNLFSG